MPLQYTAVYKSLRDAVKLYHLELNTMTKTEIPNFSSFSLTRQTNAPATWSVSCVNENPAKIFSPFGVSQYTPLLRPDIYTAAHTIHRVFYLEITLDGYVWNSPWLVLETTDYTSEGIITLSGTDWSKRLTIENQSMTSYISKPGQIYRAKEIIDHIISVYGCTGDLNGFEDYPVKVLHFQNEKPIDPILRILDIKGGHWCIRNNNTFRAWVPLDYSNGPAAWTFEHGRSLINLRYTSSSGNIYNQVTIGRSDASNNIVGFMEGRDYGRFSISFDPSVHVSLVAEETSGCVLVVKGVYVPAPTIGVHQQMQDLTTWTDTTGKTFGYDSTNDISEMGANPLVKVDFTIGVCSADPLGSHVPYWRVHVQGKRAADIAQVFGPFEEIKSVLVKDSELIAKYGVCPAPDMPDNAFIYDIESATAYGRRIIRDSCRTLETCECAVPFNPVIDLGDTCRVIYGDLDIDHYFCVEGINLGIDCNSGSVTCNVGLTKYQHNLLAR